MIVVTVIMLSMKKITVVASIALTGLVTSVVYANLNPISATTTDDFPIVQQVEDHENRLDNQEARLTNVESDVTDLQTNTNTPPSIQRVNVPAVPPPEPSPTPVQEEPKAITVVSYRKIAVEGTEDTDCEYTYSDGTVYSWRWRMVSYNQGTKSTTSYGECNDSVLGNPKVT